MAIAVIGNGLYAMTSRRKSLLDIYRERQAKCAHAKRDPKGTCYECGHKGAK